MLWVLLGAVMEFTARVSVPQQLGMFVCWCLVEAAGNVGELHWVLC